MPDGPFAPFLRSLASVQSALGENTTRIRTALVTARGGPAHERVIRTLRAWGVRVDAAFFLGGLPKQEVLRAFKPHIFFDDQESNLEPVSDYVPSIQVPIRRRPIAAPAGPAKPPDA